MSGSVAGKAPVSTTSSSLFSPRMCEPLRLKAGATVAVKVPSGAEKSQPVMRTRNPFRMRKPFPASAAVVGLFPPLFASLKMPSTLVLPRFVMS